MLAYSRSAVTRARRQKLEAARDILQRLGFGSRQQNEVAAFTLLALLDLRPPQSWDQVAAPLRGITPIIEFIRKEYGLRYAPNTRETIRDEAVKHFVEHGMVIRNPDDPKRPPNSGNTVYQVEPHALDLFRKFGSSGWDRKAVTYLSSIKNIRHELERRRQFARIPVKLPSGAKVTLSPGGQNPLIKTIVDEFCHRFVADPIVVYIGDAEDKFLHLDSEYLKQLGVEILPPAKMPDLIVHDRGKNWLLLIEAVTSAGPVDGKRRKELKELFSGCTVGLVFVTGFTSRDAMRGFLNQISWETEVWVAEDPDHLIHFDGVRFLGPYPDTVPTQPQKV